MLSSQAADAFLKLEQILISTEESSKALNNILPQAILQLNSLGFDYHVLELIMIEGQIDHNFETPPAEGQFPIKPILRHAFFVDYHSLKIQLDNNSGLVKWQVLFDPNGEWDKDLLWGKAFASSDMEILSENNIEQASHIKTLIMSPMITANKLVGVFILATSRLQSQITEDELALASMISNLLSLAYRLWDSQISLTNVTQEVYKMNTKLHELDKLKDDFVSIASHELRTPMTAIRSYAWMALHRSDIPLSDKLKKYLERTLVSTERLINLVNDMLNVSRIESGRIEIAPEAFDIQNLIGEVLIEIDAKAKEKNLNINLLKTELPKVFADSNKVHQILLNLLGNSLKFSSPNGRITVSFNSDGNNVEISIKDNGVGISKDDLARLFKKFSRLENSYVAASSTGGTGLGLYISKSLVEMMKGKIWARSEGEGKGTTFTFSLPVATPALIQESEKFHIKPVEAKLLEPVAIQAYPNEPA